MEVQQIKNLEEVMDMTNGFKDRINQQLMDIESSLFQYFGKVNVENVVEERECPICLGKIEVDTQKITIEQSMEGWADSMADAEKPDLSQFRYQFENALNHFVAHTLSKIKTDGVDNTKLDAFKTCVSNLETTIICIKNIITVVDDFNKTIEKIPENEQDAMQMAMLHTINTIYDELDKFKSSDFVKGQ